MFWCSIVLCNCCFEISSMSCFVIMWLWETVVIEQAFLKHSRNCAWLQVHCNKIRAQWERGDSLIVMLIQVYCEYELLLALCSLSYHVISYVLGFISFLSSDEFVAFVAAFLCIFISARQHAERAICYRPSVRLSVRPSVRHTGGSVENGWS